MNTDVDEHAAEASILLIDDDRELGEMLSDYFAPDHLKLTPVLNGEDGLELLKEKTFDLLILDFMLPGISGLEVLKILRQSSDMPVIMLTARGDDVDRIVGLEIGADDYLPKPFNPRELSARIKAILRRAQTAVPRGNELEAGMLRIEHRTRSVYVGAEAVRVTGTEYEILHSLMQHPGEVVSKDSLSEKALGRRLLPFDRSIDTHISNLRRKLVAAGAADETISNQRGVGYVLLPRD